MDMTMELVHDPIESGDDTGDREAIVEINTSHVIGSGALAPRLYYSVDDGAFTELQPSSSASNTYYFTIPGQPMGSKIEYYIAAQDEASTLVATLPAGGRGINPPGSIAPEVFFTYIIADINTMSTCSNTLPKNIEDLQNLYDTIYIDQEGILVKLSVELDAIHTYDGDVEIYLIGPDGTEIDLCVGHGGSGNNFINTVFDDDAATPIAQGSAPFSGSFIPDQPLATYNDMSITGDWIIRIFDNAQNDQGKLTNWCLNLQYSGDPVYIANFEERDAILHQNYPNPFIGETTFAFELHRPGHVQITIIDMMGRELGIVTDQDYQSGKHNIRWNAGNLPQGRYFYRIQTDQNVEVKSMMIVK
jgi:subtilisin-like proprotein convertase family protein